MSSLGETLRHERKQRRIDIREIARETRIDARYLSALEKNDLKQLPGGAFDRGFVRTYAEYLGLDPGAMLQAYDQQVAALREAGKLPESGDLVDEIRGSVGHRSLPSGFAWGRWIGASLAVLVLAAVVGSALWKLGPGLIPSATVRPGVLEANRPAGPESAGSTADSDTPDRPRPEAPAHPGTMVPARTAASEPTATGDRESSTPVTAPGRAPTREDEMPAAGLSVADSGVGSHIVDLQLRGRADSFEAGSAVYFWTRIVGGAEGDAIRHVWRHEGKLIGYVPLELGGPHWRTYSQRELPAERTGQWTVEVVDADGRVLAEHRFHCVPAARDAARAR